MCLQCGRRRFDSWVGKIPWRREQLHTPIFWPGEFHRLYSPGGCKESEMTEQLWLHCTSPVLWKTVFHWTRGRGIESGRFKHIAFIVHLISNLTPPLIWQEVLVHGPKVGDLCSRGSFTVLNTKEEKEQYKWFAGSPEKDGQCYDTYDWIFIKQSKYQ